VYFEQWNFIETFQPRWRHRPHQITGAVFDTFNVASHIFSYPHEATSRVDVRRMLHEAWIMMRIPYITQRVVSVAFCTACSIYATRTKVAPMKIRHQLAYKIIIFRFRWMTTVTSIEEPNAKPIVVQNNHVKIRINR
jgi:hypothetical protein